MSDVRFPSILPYKCSDMTDSELTTYNQQDSFDVERMPKSQLRWRSGQRTPNEPQALETSVNRTNDSVTIASQRRLARIHALQNEKANMDIPISRIPGEIIRLIFQCHADDNEVARVMGRTLFASTSYEVGRSWLVLGQVSRLWRQILFDMPTLWAKKLFTLGYRKVPTLLPLTKEALLDMDFCDQLGQTESTWNEMRPYMNRAWRITNESYMVDQVVPFMELLSSQPLPHLRAIKLTRSYLQGSVPSAVMSDHPNLRSIILDSVYMRSPLHGGLVSLEIDLSRSGIIERPDYNELMTILSHNRQLRRLDLKGVLHDAKKSASRLILPALESLRLNNRDHLHTACLLDSLYMPSLRTATVHPEHALSSRRDSLVVHRSLLDAWTDENTMSASSSSLVVERVFGSEGMCNIHDVALRGFLAEISTPTKQFSIAEYVEEPNPTWSRYVGRHTIRWQHTDMSD
ncbi:unnamed protein product [Peniophora sp. CBMAI 1063]|nr:unnamed protein product [Peniophora sp. CBMAI 1063]